MDFILSGVHCVGFDKCIMICVHHDSIFPILEFPCAPSLCPSPEPLIFLLLLSFCHFQDVIPLDSYKVAFAFPAVNESSCCSTSSPAFGGISVLDSGHPDRCVVVAHCFNLEFPNNIGCEASFHMLICHL